MYANLVEHNPNPILSLDETGNVIYANPSAQALFNGPPPPEWRAAALLALKNPSEYRADGMIDAIPASYGDAPTTKLATRLVFNYKSNQRVYQFTLLSDPSTGGLMSFGQDISQQQALEEARRLSEERFSLASRAAPGVLYDWNLVTNKVYMSHGLGEMIGFSPEDVLEDPTWWQSRIHRDEYTLAQETLQKILDGASDSLSSEYRIEHADGHWVYVWDRAYVMRDLAGRPVRLVGQISDITERKRREKKVSFLAELAEELAGMTSPAAAAAHTARRVGEFLEVARCVVTTVEDGRIWIEADYPPNAADLDESYPLDIVSPELLSMLHVQDQIAVEDAASDPRTWKDYLAGRLPEWLNAFVSTAGVREGTWLGSLTAAHSKRRTWRNDELDLLHQANDLLWLSIEKTRLLTQNLWGERLLIRLLNEVPAGIAFLSGPDHRYAMVNTAYQRLAAGRGELLGRTVAEVWPELADEWTYILNDVYTTGEPYYRENLPERIQRHGRLEEVNFQVSCSLMTDAEGEVSGLLLMVREITQEVKTQQAIREERARLKALIEYAPVGVLLCDEAARITLANPTAEQLVNRPIPVGEPYAAHDRLELCYPDGAFYEPRDLPLTRAVLDGETSLNLDMVVVWPDGQQHPLLVNAAPVRSENGRLIGGVMVFQDISESIQLRAGLAYQVKVLETIHDAIISTDLDLKITSWNQAAETLYGWKAEEMIGKPIWDEFFVPSGYENSQMIFERMQQGEALHGDRVHYTQDGGRLFVDISASAMKDTAGRLYGYVAAIRDVTDRREAEEALRRYATQLEQSNRDLEDFAFIASHDMQEPLRKVRAFGDLLKANYHEKLDARGGDYVDRMVNAAVRMQRMLESLLAYSRASTRGLHFEEVDLNAAAAAALEDLDDRMRRTGGVVDIGPLPTIEADPQQMEQIFQNLIGNGLKFQAPGVAPRVRVEARILPGNLAEITVSDNGVGFSMEFIDRLFQPFQRLHGRSAFEGSGVGLAICRKIIERHGGSISGQAQPGQGAVFVVRLPLKTEALG